MRSRPVRCALLTLAASPLLAVRIHAQEAPARDTLLDRLTAEAVAANPALNSRRAVAAAAGARVRPAGALPDPMLEVGVMDLVLPDFAFRRDNFTEVDIQLSQEFPWPGTLGARTAAARATADARASEVAARRRDVIVGTAELYYRLRYVVTARATLTRQRTLLVRGVEISTARYASTTAPQSDPLQARVALARLDAEDADLAAQEAESRARLQALRNVSAPDSLLIESIRPEQVGIAAHLADSLLEHPRLAARRAEIEAAERMVRVEQLGARPDFTIMAR
jgi:outer membrane protein TolC